VGGAPGGVHVVSQVLVPDVLWVCRILYNNGAGWGGRAPGLSAKVAGRAAEWARKRSVTRRASRKAMGKGAPSSLGVVNAPPITARLHCQPQLLAAGWVGVPGGGLLHITTARHSSCSTPASSRFFSARNAAAAASTPRLLPSAATSCSRLVPMAVSSLLMACTCSARQPTTAVAQAPSHFWAGVAVTDCACARVIPLTPAR